MNLPALAAAAAMASFGIGNAVSRLAAIAEGRYVRNCAGLGSEGRG